MLGLMSRKWLCSLLSNKLTFTGLQAAGEGSELFEQKQTNLIK